MQEKYYKEICNLVGIQNNKEGKPFKSANQKTNKNNIDSSLLERAFSIYEELCSNAF